MAKGGSKGGGSSSSKGNSSSSSSSKSSSGSSGSSSKSSSSSLGSAVKAAGANLSKNEAAKIAENTGKSVAEVMAKAIGKGVTLGSNLVNNFNAGNLGPNFQTTGYSGTGAPVIRGNQAGVYQALEALKGLQGLRMGQGQAYAGYSTTTTPARGGTSPSSGSWHTPGTTTYNPVVLPKNVATGRGPGGAGGATTDTNGDGRIDANDLPAKNNGEYDNILENLKHQAAAGDAEAAYWRQKQIDDAAAYAQQLAAIQAEGDQNAAALQDLMIQQQDGFDQQMALQQQQLQSAQSAYQEQLRQADALSRAYVPTLQATANAPISGDYRTSSTSSNTNSSTLSSLSILSDMGSVAPSLVGLQIA